MRSSCPCTENSVAAPLPASCAMPTSAPRTFGVCSTSHGVALDRLSLGENAKAGAAGVMTVRLSADDHRDRRQYLECTSADDKRMSDSNRRDRDDAELSHGSTDRAAVFYSLRPCLTRIFPNSLVATSMMTLPNWFL